MGFLVKFRRWRNRTSFERAQHRRVHRALLVVEGALATSELMRVTKGDHIGANLLRDKALLLREEALRSVLPSETPIALGHMEGR